MHVQTSLLLLSCMSGVVQGWVDNSGGMDFSASCVTQLGVGGVFQGLV